MKKRFSLKRKIEKRDVISLVVVGLLLVLFVFIGIEYVRRFGDTSGGMEGVALNVKEMIQGYGAMGVVMFIMLHYMQVIVAAIPAALGQFVGGVIYGTFWGVVTAQIGILLGSLTAFYISRVFGRRIVTLFVSPDSIEKIERIIAKNSSSLVLFCCFLVPGFPKDFLPYAVGLTGFNPVRFHILSVLGRLPSIIVSTYLGAHVIDGDPTMLIIVTSATVILFFLMYIFKNKIFNMLSRKSH